jgi:hypothetical protein
MDPQACLDRMIEALKNYEYDEADAARTDLWEWIGKGGFISADQMAMFQKASDELNLELAENDESDAGIDLDALDE